MNDFLPRAVDPQDSDLAVGFGDSSDSARVEPKLVELDLLGDVLKSFYTDTVEGSPVGVSSRGHVPRVTSDFVVAGDQKVRVRYNMNDFGVLPPAVQMSGQLFFQSSFH